MVRSVKRLLSVVKWDSDGRYSMVIRYGWIYNLCNQCLSPL